MCVGDEPKFNERTKSVKRHKINAHDMPWTTLWVSYDDSEIENRVQQFYGRLFPFLRLRCAHVGARVSLGHMVNFLHNAHKRPSIYNEALKKPYPY
jgi:hypothetical protein